MIYIYAILLTNLSVDKPLIISEFLSAQNPPLAPPSLHTSSTNHIYVIDRAESWSFLQNVHFSCAPFISTDMSDGDSDHYGDRRESDAFFHKVRRMSYADRTEMGNNRNFDQCKRIYEDEMTVRKDCKNPQCTSEHVPFKVRPPFTTGSTCRAAKYPASNCEKNAFEMRGKESSRYE